MRVTLGTGARSIFLAGPTPREEAADDWSFVPDFELQTVARVRADVTEFYDRLNDKLTLSFEATHEYRSRAAAEQACADHVAAIRAIGQSSVNLIYGYAPNVTTYQIANALVKAKPGKVRGIAITWHYDIYGGKAVFYDATAQIPAVVKANNGREYHWCPDSSLWYPFAAQLNDGVVSPLLDQNGINDAALAALPGDQARVASGADGNKYDWCDGTQRWHGRYAQLTGTLPVFVLNPAGIDDNTLIGLNPNQARVGRGSDGRDWYWCDDTQIWHRCQAQAIGGLVTLNLNPFGAQIIP